MLHENRALLDRFRRGDRDALRAVYEAFVDDVLVVVRSGVRVQTDAGLVRLGQDIGDDEVEALVQETFIKAFSDKARQSYDGLRPYGAYLSTVARNLVIDRGRRLAKERKHEVRGIELDRVAGPDAPADEVQEAGELVRLVDGFVEGLTPPDSDVFRVRYGDGLSLDRAAAALSLGVGKVRRIDARLRLDLLNHLRKHGFLQNAAVAIGRRFLPRKNGAQE